MEKKQLSAYVIGPSNNGIKNLWEYGKLKAEEYKKYINGIANVLNNYFDVVGCIPDISVPFDIIQEIHKIPNRNVKIQGFYPKIGDDTFLQNKKSLVDEMILINGGWSQMNTEISKNFDY